MTKIFNEEAILKDNEGRILSTQYPLSVDGDSVYSKDIDYLNSTIGTFSGSVLSLFDNYLVENIDTSATNPKTINIILNRPIRSNKIGIGSRTGNFSNVKIELKDFSGTTRTILDDSSNSTKYSSFVYQFIENVFIEATITFHTIDPVKINGLYIPKVQLRAISSIDGFISETNSSETNLLANGVFTGGEVDTKDYGMMMITVFSDVASAINGLEVQFRSTLSGVWRTSDNFSISTNSEKTFSLQPVRRYMRVIYTNGATNQTVFDLQTILKPVYVKPSSHRIADNISGQDDAELVKSCITGLRDDLIFGNVRISNSDKLKVVTQEFGYAISQGDITDKIAGEAKGERMAIAVVTTGVDVWAGIASTIPIPPDLGDLISIVSTSAEDTNITGTGIWVLYMYYIDAVDGLEKELLINLNGTTPVDTGVYARYINKMYSLSADGALGAVGTITAYKTGTPTTIYRQINPGGNTDLGCDFMVPGNRTMYLTEWKCSVAGAGKPVAMRLRATMGERSGTITPRIFHTFDTDYLETSTGGGKFEFPVKMPPYTIIKVTGYASQAGPYIAAGFAGWMELI